MARSRYMERLSDPDDETKIAPAVLLATGLIAVTLVAGILYRLLLVVA